MPRNHLRTQKLTSSTRTGINSEPKASEFKCQSVAYLACDLFPASQFSLAACHALRARVANQSLKSSPRVSPATVLAMRGPSLSRRARSVHQVSRIPLLPHRRVKRPSNVADPPCQKALAFCVRRDVCCTWTTSLRLTDPHRRSRPTSSLHSNSLLCARHRSIEFANFLTPHASGGWLAGWLYHLGVCASVDLLGICSHLVIILPFVYHQHLHQHPHTLPLSFHLLSSCMRIIV